MAKLELALLVGDESKKWLAELESVVTRLEVTMGDKKVTADKEEKAVTKAPALKASAKVKEDTFDLGEEKTDEEQTPITIGEVIAACKANRKAAIDALKKMKVKSVYELKPAQYSKMLMEIGV